MVLLDRELQPHRPRCQLRQQPARFHGHGGDGKAILALELCPRCLPPQVDRTSSIGEDVHFARASASFANVALIGQPYVDPLLDGSGQVSKARIGVTGSAVKGYRALDAEKALAGKKPDAAAVKSAAALATKGIDPTGDIWASSEYRAHLTQVYTERAITAAVARARG